MKPHRVRMANSLVLHYGLHSKLDGVRGCVVWCCVTIWAELPGSGAAVYFPA